MAVTLVGRHQRLSFAKVGETYTRMTKFTQISESKSPIEYSRQYVDEASESTDVVGYSDQISYSFDRHTETPVHDFIAKVTDDELLGTDAHLEIVTVDLFDPAGGEDEGGLTCTARHRKYSVVPDATGDGTDALIYSGTFKAVSKSTKGKATTSDGWQTVTFVEEDK